MEYEILLHNMHYDFVHTFSIKKSKDLIFAGKCYFLVITVYLLISINSLLKTDGCLQTQAAASALTNFCMDGSV